MSDTTRDDRHYNKPVRLGTALEIMANHMALYFGTALNTDDYSHPQWLKWDGAPNAEAWARLPELRAAIERRMRAGLPVMAQQGNAMGGGERLGKMFGVERHGRNWRYWEER